ncbi:MAG: hypothetical protein R3C14_13215 [Caldilineaceae bacterium]
MLEIRVIWRVAALLLDASFFNQGVQAVHRGLGLRELRFERVDFGVPFAACSGLGRIEQFNVLEAMASFWKMPY